VTHHSYGSSREKRVDLWVGFSGWILTNGLLLSAAIQMGDGSGVTVAVLLLLANLIAPIVLALTRRFVAFGIGLAFGTILCLFLAEAVFAVIGLFITAFTGGLETNYCADYRGGICVGSPQLVVALIVGCVVFFVPTFFVLRGIHQQIR
jgi:hypothetical protein